MMLDVGSFGESYENFVEALTRDPEDAAAQAGIVRAAVASQRESESLAFLRKVASDRPRAAGPQGGAFQTARRLRGRSGGIEGGA